MMESCGLHLGPNEIVTRIVLPASSRGWRGSYQKLRVRGSIDYPLAGVAVALKLDRGRVEDARMAITAVNPAPHLVKDVDAQLDRRGSRAGVGRGDWRVGGTNRQAADDVGADPGISPRDGEGFRQASVAGRSRQLT